MLYFPKNIYHEIIGHAKLAYPYECCGALIGKGKKVVNCRLMENINKERANDRYEINPKELLQVEKEASLNGLEIIGFYHSHPDHPDRPSSFDRERAWPLYSYVIISVQNGKTASVKSWTFEDEKEAFREEEIVIP
ncbi:MAG: M67 family metallopeptidase [Deltaproteobacteria bacterium]|nr:M67 family metallopeptidase [Deltaproteobacteria bacterium]